MKRENIFIYLSGRVTRVWDIFIAVDSIHKHSLSTYFPRWVQGAEGNTETHTILICVEKQRGGGKSNIIW